MTFHWTIMVQYISVIIGIPINVLVLLVRFIKLKERKRMSSYHIIITNLAIADLTSSTMLAFEIKNATHEFVWPFSLTMCYIVKGVSLTTTSIGGLLILLLSFERYYGTINLTTRKWQRKTTVAMTFLIWISAFLIRLPDIMNIHMYQHHNLQECNNMTFINGTGNFTITNNTVFHQRSSSLSSTLCKPDTCVIEEMHPSQRKIYLNFKFILTIFVPFLATIFLHYKLYLFIKTHARHMMLMSCNSSSQMFINQAYINNNKNNINNNNNNNNKRKYSPETFIPSLGNETQRKSLEAISENKMLLSSDSATLKREGEVEPNQSFIRQQAKKIKLKFTIRKSSTSSQNAPKIHARKKRRRAVNKNIRLKLHVLYSISIALFVFSLPYYTWNYLFLYSHSTLVTLKWKILLAFTYIRYLHCFVNGLIYSVIDKRFRNDVYILVKTLMTCKKQSLNNMDGLLIPSGIRTRTTSFDSNP